MRPVWPVARSGAFAGTDLAGADLAGADFAGADFAGADFVVALLFEALVPEVLVLGEPAAGAVPEAPARAEQTGQAPQPWAPWTLVATAICALLEAWSAVGA
ncbi:pentapeptide repeat-containing protein [Streptomyces sp. BK340]|uniref:pentapeptide repeat-containing protein n=1 Tax=Streptomyces sp. BK340 TaxID=2572903 RepID=UPI0037D9ECA7